MSDFTVGSFEDVGDSTEAGYNPGFHRTRSGEPKRPKDTGTVTLDEWEALQDAPPPAPKPKRIPPPPYIHKKLLRLVTAEVTETFRGGQGATGERVVLNDEDEYGGSHDDDDQYGYDDDADPSYGDLEMGLALEESLEGYVALELQARQSHVGTPRKFHQTPTRIVAKLEHAKACEAAEVHDGVLDLCDGKHYANHLCRRHYEQFGRSGDTLEDFLAYLAGELD
jgi:hypothetical protein